MNARKTMLVAGALLLAGCNGKIGAMSDPASGPGPGAGMAGNTVSGAGGAGVVPTGTGSVTGNPAICTPGVPATTQLPRLTRAQYDATIKELFTLDTQPSGMLAPDTTGDMDERGWTGFQTAADTVAKEVMATPAARAKVVTCTPTGDGAACAKTIVEQLGRRAFRRPLTTDEVNKFVKLFTDRMTITEAGTFDQAITLIIKGFLLSPSFLTRAETSDAKPEGALFALSGYEMASRLSYLLWGSMPDEALFNAAAAGSLGTASGVLEQARRMLADPRARTKVADFHQSYAHMGAGTRWADISRDPQLFPSFSPAVTPLLSEGTKRFFDHIVFEKGGTFKDLILSPVAFVNATLAPLYGLSPSGFGAELVPTELDPAKRAGVFTQLGFLTAYSLYDRASPILRGAFIQKEVLCTVIPPPPPGVEGTPFPTTGNTNRERVDAQTSGGDCVTCHHAVINPTGFALEAYDAVGAYQTTEKGSNAPIDTTANVALGARTVPVSGPVDLMTKIASSPEAQQCYAQRWLQVAYERAPNGQDTCVAQELAGKMAQGNYTVLNLVADLTQSQSFRYRAKELP